ncbi:MAG: hypothetical protein SNG10_05505 [Rikenellaceae bacterium]
MKKFKHLLLAIICAVSISFSSCDLWEDAVNNSITGSWVSTMPEGTPGWTIYYTYELNYDGTFTWEQYCTDGKYYDAAYDDYTFGEYDFSNYYKKLTLYYNGRTVTYNAYVSNGVLYIEEQYIDNNGYYFEYTPYYRF